MVVIAWLASAQACAVLPFGIIGTFGGLFFRIRLACPRWVAVVSFGIAFGVAWMILGYGKALSFAANMIIETCGIAFLNVVAVVVVIAVTLIIAVAF